MEPIDNTNTSDINYKMEFNCQFDNKHTGMCITTIPCEVNTCGNCIVLQISISLVVTLHLRPLSSTYRAGVEPR